MRKIRYNAIISVRSYIYIATSDDFVKVNIVTFHTITFYEFGQTYQKTYIMNDWELI